MKFWFRFPASLSSDATRTQRRRSLLLAVVLITVLPLAYRGPSCGQDADFHLQNWLEVVAHWQHGVLYPHWAASANYLAGEPRFVFYPPLSWMLGGLLGVILPWTWTPLAFTLLALLAAGFTFRAMAREWMPLDSATIAACLYVLNPYMLFVAYERGAMAELLAAAWMPFLVLYGLREKRAFLPLSLTVAAIWLTNAPAAVMGCYMLAVLVLVASLQRKSWNLVGRAVGAVTLGLGLAGFWLVPALYEQRWVQIARAIGPLMRVEDSFLFGYASLFGVPADEQFDTIYHNQVLRTASWIVVALFAGAVIAAWLARRKRNPVSAPLIAVGAIILLLQLRWSDVVWRLAPELKFLQFPWRWMMVLGLVFAALAGIAIRSEQTTRRSIAVRGVVMLALAGGMAILSSVLFWQPCDDEDNVAAQIATFHSTGFEGTDEYTLKGVDESQLAGIAPGFAETTGPVVVVTAENTGQAGLNQLEIPANVKIERWNADRMSAVVSTERSGYAVLRLTDYPAWRVTRNGAQIGERPHRADGLMVIPLNPGVNQIDVRWRLTADQWTGIGIFLAALAITLGLGWKERRRLDVNGFR